MMISHGDLIKQQSLGDIQGVKFRSFSGLLGVSSISGKVDLQYL